MFYKRWSLRTRLLFLVACGAVLVLGLLGYSRYWLERPIGSGPAGPSVAREPFAEPWTQRRVMLLGLGDSITAGLGAKGKDHSYFNRLVRNPDDEFPELKGLCLSKVLPNLETRNLAVSGSTSLAHEITIADRVEVFDEDVFGLVVMTTGGNDIIHSYGRRPPREGAMYGATLEQARPWIANFEQRLNRMLDELNARFPGGCQIMLADIYDPTDGVGDAPSVYLKHWKDGLAIHAAYNDVIHRCAEQRGNVRLTPLRETFLGHGSHCRQFWRATYRPEDPHYWFYDNVEDPNDRGYDAIRRVFLTEIVEHVAPQLQAENRPKTLSGPGGDFPAR